MPLQSGRPLGRPPKDHSEVEIPVHPEKPIEAAAPMEEKIAQPEPIYPMQNKTSAPVPSNPVKSSIAITGNWIEYKLETASSKTHEFWNLNRINKIEASPNTIRDQVIFTFDNREKCSAFVNINDLKKMLAAK